MARSWTASSILTIQPPAGNTAKKKKIKKKHNFYITQGEQREKFVNSKNYSNYLFPRLGSHQRISNPAAQQA